MLILLIACEEESSEEPADAPQKDESEQREDTSSSEEPAEEADDADEPSSQEEQKALEINTDLDLDSYPTESTEWGENVTGVKNKLATDEQVVALTFDACGGPHGSKYDEELIEYLIDEEIPATLFVNKRWILSNEELFQELSDNPLFQIENHGTDHLPLSVEGKEAWGIEGTESPEDVYHEVVENHRLITDLTGQEPSNFRSGTAFYDEVAVEIVNDIGLEVVNFDILGDAGGTYSSDEVERSLLGATAGSIALLHMNQPESGTADGVKNAIPHMKEKGFEFVLLEEYDLE
ncbi:polysaccharide deacetylase family protein [Halalkalibacillus sediminis]|nr:polysaccharide deacetylase family protein [Halalkalibacillus sediminis]